MNKNKSIVGGNKDKKVQLNVRISRNEIKRLKRRANKSGLNFSEYVRILLSECDEKKQSLGMVNHCITLCQDILNIVQEKYSCEDNSLLEEKVEELWKILA